MLPLDGAGLVLPFLFVLQLQLPHATQQTSKHQAEAPDPTGLSIRTSTTHTTREEKGLASRPLHPSSQIYSRRRALIDTFDCTVPSFQRTTQTLQQVHNGPYPTDLSLPLRHKSRY
ncbi:hypothetical protein PG995_002562 [Apiospora arundinis]